MHGYTLHADDLEDVLSLLASNTIAERKTFPGLDPRRADIILGGAIRSPRRSPTSAVSPLRSAPAASAGASSTTASSIPKRRHP